MTATTPALNALSMNDIEDQLPTSGGKLTAILNNIETSLAGNDPANKAIAASLARHIQAKILQENKQTAFADIRSMQKLDSLIRQSEPIELAATLYGTTTAAYTFGKNLYTTASAGAQLLADYQKNPFNTIDKIGKGIKHAINNVTIENIANSINQWGEEDNTRRADILRIENPEERAFADSQRKAEILINGTTMAYGAAGASKLGGKLLSKIAGKFDDLPFDGVLVADGIGLSTVNIGLKTSAAAAEPMLPTGLSILAMKTEGVNEFDADDGIEEKYYEDLFSDDFPQRTQENHPNQLPELDTLSEIKIRLRRESIANLAKDGEFNFNFDRLQQEKFNITEILKDREITRLEAKFGAQIYTDAPPSINSRQQLQHNLNQALNQDPRVLPDKQAIHAVSELLDTRPGHITKDTKKLLSLLSDELDDYANLARGNVSGETIPQNHSFGSDRNRLFRGGVAVELNQNTNGPEL